VTQADLALVRRIEAHAEMAWPAAEAVMLKGWRLGITPGSTSKRINALTPVAPGPDGFEAVLASARAVWAARGMRGVVRLTPLAGPEPVAVLDALATRAEGETVVEVLATAPGPADPGVVFADEASADWIAVTARQEADRAVIAERLAQVSLPQALAAVRAQDGRIAAVGRAAAGDGLVGLFHIATDPAFRRRGLGGRIVAALLDWGYRQGAPLAYLQVEVANAAALGVYEGAGFREAYRYHYRMLAV
jgi:ribosomal protein S18 acetylase RimI-like enzyme